MQEHDQPQGASVLALTGDSVSVKRLQKTMHLMHAYLFTQKWRDF
jgi:hypothetical protein